MTTKPARTRRRQGGPGPEGREPGISSPDQLDALAIHDEFTKVFAFPDKKADVLTELKERHPARTIVFWADTMLDYEASQTAQVTFIGVCQSDANPFAGLDVHTIDDFEDRESLHAWIGTHAFN